MNETHYCISALSKDITVNTKFLQVKVDGRGYDLEKMKLPEGVTIFGGKPKVEERRSQDVFDTWTFIFQVTVGVTIELTKTLALSPVDWMSQDTMKSNRVAIENTKPIYVLAVSKDVITAEVQKAVEQTIK